MHDPEYDLTYLRAAQHELENYLLSDELFWPMGVSASADQPSYPRLTLGNLLLAQARLRALEKGGHTTPAQRSELQRLERAIGATQSSWQVAWEGKATREFKSRFHQWANYLSEVEEAPERHGSYYPSEVRWRVLLELLRDQVGREAPEEVGLLPAADGRLRAVFASGDFVWDQALTAGFPESAYWYLYGGIQQS